MLMTDTLWKKKKKKKKKNMVGMKWQIKYLMWI